MLLHQTLENAARDHGAKVALKCGTVAYTYADIDRQANTLAQFLRSRGVTVQTHNLNQLQAQPFALVFVGSGREVRFQAIAAPPGAGGVYYARGPRRKRC